MDDPDEIRLLDLPFVDLRLTSDEIFYARLRNDVGSGVDEVLGAIQPHLEAHAPVRYLVDVSEIPELGLDERWKLSSRMKANRALIHRTAVLGLSTARLFMFNVIVRASGRSNLRAFNDPVEARRWLQSD